MAEIYVFDLESDGLLDDVTKIHCLSYTVPGSDEVQTLTDYSEMKDFLSKVDTLIGHNIILYDIPVLEKILGIKIEAKLIDTLALSWYINHDRIIHGLDSYGKDYGVPKPKIDDWENLTIEEYCHRCEEDVKINQRLWKDLRRKLIDLYEDQKEAGRFISYLMFKMECAALQQESRWKLDKELATESRDTLLKQLEEKVEELKLHMQPVEKYVEKSRPAKPFTKDGSKSVAGAKWFALLRENGLPEDYNGTVSVLASVQEPNPGSHAQVKDWLFSLGWEPMNFKFEKNSDGTERQIPQVRVDGDEGKELCPSVLELAEEHPAINILDGITVIQHRLSIFEGLLSNEKGGYLTAEIGGLTNTLRFKHRVLVNLPGVVKPWGKEIRGSLIANEGNELCGADMVSLEDTTKRHYMWDYDPEYVTEMAREGFDPHLDLAKYAGVVTQQEIDDYVNKVPGAKDLKPIRKNYKQANYACIYGVGGPKLARGTGLSLKEAKQLIETYWKRNWSIKTFSETREVKHIGRYMWVKNPVSGFWYSLRAEKDIFSTVNQSTGVFCFDSWLKETVTKRKQLTAQFHDEGVWEIKKGHREDCTKLLKDAIKEVNNKLQLNIQLDVDVQFGNSYADIH